MAWTAGVDVTTGDLISAADWNSYLGTSGSLNWLNTNKLSSASGGAVAGDVSLAVGKRLLVGGTTYYSAATTPYRAQVRGALLVCGMTNQNPHGTSYVSNEEKIRLAGTDSDVVISSQDGNGRLVFYWNSTSFSPNNRYLASNEPAGQWVFNPASASDDMFSIYTAGSGTASAAINWKELLRCGTSQFTYSGYAILHAGNKDAYLTGVSGNTILNAANKDLYLTGVSGNAIITSANYASYISTDLSVGNIKQASYSNGSAAQSTYYPVLNTSGTGGYLYQLMGAVSKDVGSGVVFAGELVNFRVTIDSGSAITLADLDIGDFSLDDIQAGFDPGATASYAARRIILGGARFASAALVEISKDDSSTDTLHGLVHYAEDQA